MIERFPWPEEKKAAIALSFDVDGETAAFTMDREGAAGRLSLQSQHRYGPVVGVSRILELLDLYEVKATFFIPGFTAEQHPQTVREIAAAGHEIGHHGYMHERPDLLEPKIEERVLFKGIEVLEGLTGGRPKAYRAPAAEVSKRSIELLISQGFTYDSSLSGHDIPYCLQSQRGSLLELPGSWLNDDWAHYGPHGVSSPEQVFDIYAREFDALYNRGAFYTLVMHPFVTGRPSWLAILERQLRFMRGYPRVWWTTLGEVAEYCKSPDVAKQMIIESVETAAPNWLG